jgi:hypothetical protein
MIGTHLWFLHSRPRPQGGEQTSALTQTPKSLQNRGGRQFSRLQVGLTQLPSSHFRGGWQLLGLQAAGGALSTTSLVEIVTSSAVMTRARSPAVAVDARSKERVTLCGVALLNRMLETPVPGLMLIWAGGTCDKSRKPLDLMVSTAGLPAITDFGVTLMGGSACAGEITKVRRAAATRTTIDR